MGGIMAALEQVEFVMEAVTFTEFIYEEALQTAFFALSNAVRAKQYELAKSIWFTIMIDIIPHVTVFTYGIGFISIYSWGAFKAFSRSSWSMLTHYRDLLNLADLGYSEQTFIHACSFGYLAGLAAIDEYVPKK